MTETTHHDTLYEDVGGTDAIKALVGDLHERILADDRLAHIFEKVDDLTALRAHTVRMLVAALGGPDHYDGRDMASAHAGYPIGEAEFCIVVGHIAAAAAALDVAPPLIDEIVSRIAPLRADIVQV